MEILISTGALIGRPNGRDYRLLKDLSKKLNCDGFEFMMYSDWYDKIDAIVDFVKENDIYTPTYHCQKSIGEAISKGGDENFKDAFTRFEENAVMAHRMGARKIVMHLWDGMTSDSHFENNLKAYKTVREIADANGIDLLIENVVCNVKDPMTHWFELFEEYPDVHFIFDTKMAAFHDQLDMLETNECAPLLPHIKHLHINDYAGGYMDWANLKTLPVGAGHVDFEKFFKLVKSIGYDDTLTLESTAFDATGTVAVDMLNNEVLSVRKML